MSVLETSIILWNSPLPIKLQTPGIVLSKCWFFYCLGTLSPYFFKFFCDLWSLFWSWPALSWASEHCCTYLRGNAAGFHLFLIASCKFFLAMWCCDSTAGLNRSWSQPRGCVRGYVLILWMKFCWLGYMHIFPRTSFLKGATSMNIRFVHTAVPRRITEWSLILCWALCCKEVWATKLADMHAKGFHIDPLLHMCQYTWIYMQLCPV